MDYRQPAEVLLLLHGVETEVFRTTYHKIKVTCRNEHGKEDGGSRNTDMKGGKWDQWVRTKTFLRDAKEETEEDRARKAKENKTCEIFSCVFSE